MIITKHARKRWPERANPDASPEDMDGEIYAAFDQATIIHEEDENEEIIQYRVKDNILFIYSTKNDKLITLVEIDFGFSPEVNLVICKHQVERILDLKARIESEEAAAALQQEEIDHRLLAVAGDIAELELKLQAHKAAEDRLKQQKVELAKALEAMKSEFMNEFSRLKYSIRYRVGTSRMKTVN